MNLEKTFESDVKKATPGQIEEAAKWYFEAEKVAHKVAENLETSLEVGASVVSAFSPRERWTSNVTKSIHFSLGKQYHQSNSFLIRQASSRIIQ